MKCNDCGNLGWGDDEGEIVYGWCRVRQYCPDLGIERDCSSFLKKRPDALTALQTKNEKLRGELEQVKRERDAAASDPVQRRHMRLYTKCFVQARLRICRPRSRSCPDIAPLHWRFWRISKKTERG